MLGLEIQKEKKYIKTTSRIERYIKQNLKIVRNRQKQKKGKKTKKN